MSLFSVYNYNTKVYDYYEGRGPGGTHAGTPPVSGGHALGATPEQAAWRVPPGAVKIGSGPLPRGRIATRGGVAALSGMGDGARWGVLAVGLLAAWRFLR